MRLRAFVLPGILVLAGGIFVTDLFTPLGIMEWIWYVIPLLLSIYLRARFATLLFAAFFSVLVIAGFFLSPSGIDRELAFLSRFVGIVVLWFIAAVLFEQIKAEEALRDSEELLRAIVEDQTELIVRWTPDGTRTFVNHAYCRFMGQSRDRLIGTSFFPDVARDRREAFHRKISLLTSKNPVATDVHSSVLENGEIRWQEWTDHGLFDDRGALVEVQSVGRDITEKEMTKQALVESEAEFRATFEDAAIPMALADMQGRITRSNPAFLKFLGYSEEELLNMAFPEFTYPHDVGADMSLYQELMAGKRNDYQIEKRYLRKEGEVVWGRLTVSLVRDQEFKPKYALGMVEDITERKRLEEQLRQSQKMEAVGQLAGGVAHDFNNLLTIIYMNTEFVLREIALPPQARDFLKEITTAAARGANLTRQLLAFGRKQVMQPAPLNLNEVIANLAKMLRRLIGENIQMEYAYAPGSPIVLADLGMMEQVLVNLVVNARDAMPQGGRLVITTEMISLEPSDARGHVEARVGDFVCLTVRDTGIGIPSPHLLRIFEPFFSTKDIGKGTGLGLATVHGIVKQHQGWIDVSSEAGKGSTFKVFLPASNLAATAMPGQPTESNLRGGTETVLLVEDDPVVRLLNCRTLQSYGYRVHEAGSGPEALEFWKRHDGKIDLLLTDVVMPGGLSGHELAAQLRSQQSDLKVIVMSGYSPDLAGKDIDFFRDTKMHFLPKPYTANTLINTVRQCLDEKLK